MGTAFAIGIALNSLFVRREKTPPPAQVASGF